MLAREFENQTARSPERTCVGCREVADPSAMLRLVLGPDGSVVPDLARGAFGRGAWVHPRRECLAGAAKRGLSKAFRTGLRTTEEELHASLMAQAERRAGSLLLSAKGAGKLCVGKTDVDEALEQGRALLLVVASDARAATDSRLVQKAIADGSARVFLNKEGLGKLLGKSEVGVLAVVDQGLSRALSETLEVMMIPKPGAQQEAPRVKEDG